MGYCRKKFWQIRGRHRKEELETYEEERRLFYVGVTRAKNQLNVFTTNKPSKFCSELLGKRNLRENRQKEYAGIKKWGDYSPAGTYGVKGNGMYHGYGTGHGSQKQPGKSYQELADALGEGMIVKHKKFGEGVVVDMEGDHIRIPVRRQCKEHGSEGSGKTWNAGNIE